MGSAKLNVISLFLKFNKLFFDHLYVPEIATGTIGSFVSIPKIDAPFLNS